MTYRCMMDVKKHHDADAPSMCWRDGFHSHGILDLRLVSLELSLLIQANRLSSYLATPSNPIYD